MFCKHLEMIVDENETSVLMVCHPMIVKDLFLDITRLFDYNIYVRIDGKELEYLEPDVTYDGYNVIFYFRDTAEVTFGSRIEISITFWYRSEIVRYFNGSENIRRDEIGSATEHWTYMEDGQFHIDPEDETDDPSKFFEMLKPEWKNKVKKENRFDINDEEIIDVEFTEINEEDDEYGYGRKQIECRNDEETS